MRAKSASFTRPPGYAPEGTSAGLFSYAMLGAGVPFAIMQSLVPVLTNGLNIWLGSILPVLGFATILTLVMTLGLHKRSLWFVRYMFAMSTVLLVGYGLGVMLSIAILLEVVPVQHRDWHFMSVVNIIYWAVQAGFVWFLVRMLRLHHWQPWTMPESWSRVTKPRHAGACRRRAGSEPPFSKKQEATDFRPFSMADPVRRAAFPIPHPTPILPA